MGGPARSLRVPRRGRRGSPGWPASRALRSGLGRAAAAEPQEPRADDTGAEYEHDAVGASLKRVPDPLPRSRERGGVSASAQGGSEALRAPEPRPPPLGASLQGSRCVGLWQSSGQVLTCRPLSSPRATRRPLDSASTPPASHTALPLSLQGSLPRAGRETQGAQALAAWRWLVRRDMPTLPGKAIWGREEGGRQGYSRAERPAPVSAPPASRRGSGQTAQCSRPGGK